MVLLTFSSLLGPILWFFLLYLISISLFIYFVLLALIATIRLLYIFIQVIFKNRIN